MFKSIISKFIFYFWFFFLIVTIPIYFLASYQFKDIIKSSEEEKITLTLDTLKPIIAIHIFFDQKNQLNELLNNMFKHNYIQSVKLVSLDGKTIYEKSRKTIEQKNIEEHNSYVLDPVDKIKYASINVKYANNNLIRINDKIIYVLSFTFIFAIIVFASAYLYIRNDLLALKTIVDTFKHYSKTKDTKLIVESSKSREISTIAKVANEMFINIEDYLTELKDFNHKLENKVQEEIQKQKNQEKMMIHQSRQAAMGEMLESIAHQWRQPLNIIGIATANMDMEYKLGVIDEKKFDEKIELISLNINYMSDTIDDFRNFLNPDREMKSFSPVKGIKDVLTILEAQLINYGIKSNLKIEDELMFYGVENEFKQVMMILINNSKDAIKSKTDKKKIKYGKLDITLKLDEDDKGIVRICDNGGGIPEDIIDSIFDPYFSTKFNAQGTGIGLYLAKNIIESRMQGKIDVKNTEIGCCFTLSLPSVNQLIRES
jgi:signal transduction histidine kinase